ncbi:MAG: InlB B-repeat-containing protein, partial [Candidatus Faecousia sp.]|nr:InlB B-repeat-containing protein [Candidatus Faecousia sp.]
MKKAIPAVILVLCLVLCLTGCRRRIMVNAEQIVYETTQSRQDTEPTQPEQEETVPETKEAMPVTQSEDSHREEQPQIIQTPGSPDGGTTPVQATEPTQPPEAKEITVTLRPNRGECDVESLTVTVGKPYGQLPVATRPGYTFTGWYAASNGGRQITAETLVTNSENHSLYAHW